MRKLQSILLKRLIDAKMELNIAYESGDLSRSEWQEIKDRKDKAEAMYNLYMSACGYVRYWYVDGSNYYGDWHVVDVWLKGDNHDRFVDRRLYRSWIEAEMVCNHLLVD